MQTIGIICAMNSELARIKEALHNSETQQVGRMTFHVGKLGGKRVAAALCGIGKVNAAAFTQTLISNLGADYIINSGVSGALSSSLHIMDIVAATDLMHHDLFPNFLEGEGYFPNCARFPADERLSGLVEEICKEQGVPCVRGRIVSGEQFVNDSALKTQIIEKTQGITTEMEGAAVGHVCYLNNIPFTVVRCISDGADDNGAMDFDTFVVHAAERCAKITLALVERI
ncbi:MAG: 5'-methylthioadenosine/adenosylhomocysteine nucleosidase [Anaerotruncus sp.]|nr:5'-methylthioadenosine/adenosylhomocysteine nucleosidase [Anaerotruncus sp.]